MASEYWDEENIRDINMALLDAIAAVSQCGDDFTVEKRETIGWLNNIQIMIMDLAMGNLSIQEVSEKTLKEIKNEF